MSYIKLCNAVAAILFKIELKKKPTKNPDISYRTIQETL